MGRKRVVHYCKGCGVETENRRHKYCPACREEWRAKGRANAVKRNQELANERRKADSRVNHSMERQLNQAKKEAAEKFNFWKPLGKAICQEGESYGGE